MTKLAETELFNDGRIQASLSREGSKYYLSVSDIENASILSMEGFRRKSDAMAKFQAIAPALPSVMTRSERSKIQGWNIYTNPTQTIGNVRVQYVAPEYAPGSIDVMTLQQWIDELCADNEDYGPGTPARDEIEQIFEGHLEDKVLETFTLEPGTYPCCSLEGGFICWWDGSESRIYEDASDLLDSDPFYGQKILAGLDQQPMEEAK